MYSITVVWWILCIPVSYKDREERVSRGSRNQSEERLHGSQYVRLQAMLQWNKVKIDRATAHGIC